MKMSSSEHHSKDPPSSKTFKILIATDIHLGYEESLIKKTDRRDSFTTFEEILQIAMEKDVDFLLLGGDLFHDSKPPQSVILESISILKKYCLGSRPIRFSFLSNPAQVLSNATDCLNFENENLNIGLPIFTIHGNHDNPSHQYTGTLDILGASGMVNYFAKLSDLTRITITPMVLEKDGTYIAIYGISYIRDERLSRLFSNDLVTFLRPNISEKCVNILVIHQNRAQHSRHGHINEAKLPKFFDLIFWGHEHECKIIPQEINLPNGGTYHITQPGSSVATSLCEGESKLKHVGLLRIFKSQFAIEPIRLKTVRPFVYDTISLNKIIQMGYCDPTTDGVIEYVEDYIEHTMFKKIEGFLTGHPQQPKKPLIRLKLFFTEESQKFHTVNITRKYCDKVANATDIIIFLKERTGRKTAIDDIDDDAAAALAECFQHNDTDKDWSFAIQNGIEKYMEAKNYKLKILSLLGMNEALDRCVKSRDDDAFSSIVQHQIKKTLDFFQGHKIELTDQGYEEEIKKFREMRAKKNRVEELNEYQEMLDDTVKRARMRNEDSQLGLVDSDIEEVEAPIPPTTRGRGRGSRSSRGSRGARSRARATSTSRGRSSSAKAPLNINTSTTAAGNTISRERFTQSVAQLKATQVRKPTNNISQYEAIEFSDSD